MIPASLPEEPDVGSVIVEKPSRLIRNEKIAVMTAEMINCTQRISQLALPLSSANVIAPGWLITLIHCAGNWRMASPKGKGEPVGGGKPGPDWL